MKDASGPEVRNRDEHFIDMAFELSTRSPDPSTKHGCVIVSPAWSLTSRTVCRSSSTASVIPGQS